MKSCKIQYLISIAIASMFISANAVAQADATSQRISSDFEVIKALQDTCERRGITPEQYLASSSGIVNALHNDGIIGDSDFAQINAELQKGAAKCRTVQNYYNQTEIANAAFINGQISAETRRTMQDASLRILLDAGYITQETYVQKLAEFDAEIAQYQKNAASNALNVPANQTAQAKNPANEELVRQFNERTFEITDAYFQSQLDDDAFRNQIKTALDEIIAAGLKISPQERADTEALVEKCIKYRNDNIALDKQYNDGKITISEWGKKRIQVTERAEKDGVISPDTAEEARNNIRKLQEDWEQYERIYKSYNNRVSNDAVFRNDISNHLNKMLQDGSIDQAQYDALKERAENHIVLKNHRLTIGLNALDERLASGRMPIRRYKEEAYELLDSAKSEVSPQFFEEAQKSVQDHIGEYISNGHDSLAHRPDSFLLQLGANGGAAYFSYYHYDSYSGGEDTVEWMGFAGAHVDLGYLWHWSNITMGMLVRQDINFVFGDTDYAFLGITNGLFRVATLWYDSTLMVSFDIGLGGAYNSDGSTFTAVTGLSVDYYLSDRVGFGGGFNFMYINDLNNLYFIIQPDLHFIFDL